MLNPKTNILYFSIGVVIAILSTGCSTNPSANYSYKNANINISPYGVNVNVGANYNLNF